MSLPERSEFMEPHCLASDESKTLDVEKDPPHSMYEDPTPSMCADPELDKICEDKKQRSDIENTFEQNILTTTLPEDTRCLATGENKIVAVEQDDILQICGNTYLNEARGHSEHPSDIENGSKQNLSTRSTFTDRQNFVSDEDIQRTAVQDVLHNKNCDEELNERCTEQEQQVIVDARSEQEIPKTSVFNSEQNILTTTLLEDTRCLATDENKIVAIEQDAIQQICGGTYLNQACGRTEQRSHIEKGSEQDVSTRFAFTEQQNFVSDEDIQRTVDQVDLHSKSCDEVLNERCNDQEQEIVDAGSEQEFPKTSVFNSEQNILTTTLLEDTRCLATGENKIVAVEQDAIQQICGNTYLNEARGHTEQRSDIEKGSTRSAFTERQNFVSDENIQRTAEQDDLHNKSCDEELNERCTDQEQQVIVDAGSEQEITKTSVFNSEQNILTTTLLEDNRCLATGENKIVAVEQDAIQQICGETYLDEARGHTEQPSYIEKGSEQDVSTRFAFTEQQNFVSDEDVQRTVDQVDLHNKSCDEVLNERCTDQEQHVIVDARSEQEIPKTSVFNEPQCLISTDSSNTLKVEQDVLDQICGITEQLNVVTIAGMYRTGKSYLLTRLAMRQKGFPLGSTIESKTKGIWAWCVKHPVYTDQVLLLLDTEGLGDIQKGNENHDNQIFTLALLLSSTLIYNIFGAFDQNALSKLNFISELSKHMKISETQSISTDDPRDLEFPEFVLTLRDFTLDLEAAGKEMTSDEYLEFCLKLLPGNGDDVNHFNEPRRGLVKCFKKRKCFVFETPAKRKLLKRLEDLKDEDLDEDFVESTRLFTHYVHNKCGPLTLTNGRPVNGRMFASLVTNYVSSIRNGTLPCVESALKSMIIIENEKAVKTTIAAYIKEMNDTLQLPTPDKNTINDAHTYCKDIAMNVFMKWSMMDDDHTFRSDAEKQIDIEFEKSVNRNNAESENRCKTALQQIGVTIADNVQRGVYTVSGGYKLYLADRMEIEQKYFALNDLGVKKQEMYENFIQMVKNEEESIRMSDRMITEKEVETDKQRQNAERAKDQEQAAKKQTEEAERKLKENQIQMERDAQRLRDKQMKDFKKQQAETNRRLQELEDREKENWKELERERKEKSDLVKKLEDQQYRERRRREREEEREEERLEEEARQRQGEHKERERMERERMERERIFQSQKRCVIS